MPALFAATLALSAALLFSLQPAVARMVLPSLGGTPAVWNTCMVFFQAVVLAGYALAHLLATRARPATQAAVFLALAATAAAVLPVRIEGPADTLPGSPAAWLLGRLALGAGLPVLALATASPLLQRWFARRNPHEREPYALYVASNLGSLGALVAYPVAFERWWPLDTQARLWSATYLAWTLLAALCAFASRARPATEPVGSPASATPTTPPHQPGTASVWVWIALAAVPASLLQGCTLFLTTDVASIPLLWIVPLALYLVSFVIAFSPRGRRLVRLADRALPYLAVALAYMILSRATQPVALLVALHLAFLLAAGLVCHGRLVELRPPPERLTAFYLALSIGGVVGSAFNALVAPGLFSSVAEYPAAIAAACAAILPRRLRIAPRTANPATATTTLPDPAPTPRQPDASALKAWLSDIAAAGVVGLGLGTLGLVVPWLAGETPRLRDAVVFGVPAIACCTLLDRPRRLAFALAATFATGLWLQGHWSGTRHAERNFFGITRVTRDAEGRFHQLVHGSTFHGRQFLDPARRAEPLTYYHRQGPLGRVMEEFRRRADATLAAQPDAAPPHVGIIGLGVGSSAAYAQPGDAWTFFEIDPAVIRVATDRRWFHFLEDCRAGRTRVVEGDARLQLAREPEGSFDLLVLDAFSSDAIPVHLLTREAVALYFRKLRPGGLLAIHISNRYLQLEPVVAALAADASLACRSADDTDEDPAVGKEASHWMVLARSQADLGRLGRSSPWVPPDRMRTVAPWTDQRAGVLEVFDWR